MCDIGSINPLMGELFTGQPNFARQANIANRRTQGQIDAGTGLVNSIFSGGTSPLYTPAKSVNLGQQYYTQDKFGNFVRAGGNLQRLQKKNNLFGMQQQSFQGFQPDFYRQYANSYLNYALPQVNQQYADAYRQQQFSSANRGLKGSSSDVQQRNRLSTSLGTNRQQVVNQAQQQENMMKLAVNQARENALSTLYQTASPQLAAQSATNYASALQAPSAFAPLANMFENFINQYYTNQLLKMNQAQPEYQPYEPPIS